MTNLKFRAAFPVCMKDQSCHLSLGAGIVTILMAALFVHLIDVTSVFLQANFLEGSRYSGTGTLTSRDKNLSVLTKLKSSLGTKLSQFSTLIFELWFA